MKTANKHPLQILVSKFPDATIKRIMIVDACDDVNLRFKVVLSESDRRLRVQSFTELPNCGDWIVKSKYVL
jgi:hypothetical protein